METAGSIAGVELLGPDQPEFINLLEVLWGRCPDDVLLPALPYSVIAANNSARTVAFLGVRFDMQSRAGNSYSVVHYADSLRYPENADLTPGGVRFVCAEPLYTGLVVRRQSSVDPRGPMNLGNLRKALRIRASIDSVAFDNGHFTGPDSLGAFDRLARERRVEEQFIASLLASPSPDYLLADALDQAHLRVLARKLMDAFTAGGIAELETQARRHRQRIALWR